MPSPFPGMDPWLEGPMWPDVHGSLTYTIRSALSAALPEGYAAIIDQHIWLQSEDADDEESSRIPDVFISGDNFTSPVTQSGGLVVAEPTVQVMLSAGKRTKTRRYIKLIDLEDRRVITVIEILSPSNKASGDDRQQYLLKRSEYLASDMNLVEIDLLRDGNRLPMGRPRPPQADYYLFVTLADKQHKTGIWAFTVREPIPIIPVPLKLRDGTVPLDIQSCLDRVYEESKYERSIDYSRPPEFPLRPADAAWATELLRNRPGRRRNRTSHP